MKNLYVADILDEIGDLLDIKGERFKPRAYRKAANTVRTQSKDITEIMEEGSLEELPGIGKNIAAKIKEILETGSLEYYENLKKEFPIDTKKLLAIEGVGPKTLKLFYDELKITSLEELEKAAKEKKIRGLPGMGEKSEQQILKNIAFVKQNMGRKLLGDVLPIAETIETVLKKVGDVQQIALAGSLRRRKETIGDIDILVQTTNPKKIIETFVELELVDEIIAKGETKATVRLIQGLDADLRVISSESYGAALIYFTGSKGFNIELRRIAKEYNWKLNEYGIYEGEKQLAGKTEKEVLNKLGLQFIPPEMRENRGEIQLAKEEKIPELIDYDDIKGDLQMHSTWSDGINSLEEMAVAAKELGYEYIAFTDHTEGLRVAGGMDTEEIQKQMREIDKIDKQISGLKILKGVEVNIDSKGELDMADEILRRLDVVVASIHSGFRQGKKKLTERLLTAMENEHVNIIAHPTGRKIMDREGYDLDFKRVFTKAKETNTFLEINAYPNRLDLRDIMVRDAIEHGCKLAINTDAHNTAHLKYMSLGIATARRGWAKKEDIINTLSLKELLKKIK
jgi:DNA polymerase (family 10)